MDWILNIIKKVDNFIASLEKEWENRNMEPDTVNSPVSQTEAAPVASPDPDALLPWDTQANCRHNVRALCDLEGLTFEQKNELSSTVHCESDYDPSIVMYNCEHGFVRSTAYNPAIHGAIMSEDVGIAQINSYWHIGPDKDFPSKEYVLNNPEACIRWTCKQWKAGRSKMWVCRLKNLYINYSS